MANNKPTCDRCGQPLVWQRHATGGVGTSPPSAPFRGREAWVCVTDECPLFHKVTDRTQTYPPPQRT